MFDKGWPEWKGGVINAHNSGEGSEITLKNNNIGQTSEKQRGKTFLGDYGLNV